MITMIFSHLYGMKPQKIEEVCDTPAELLASQDPARGLTDSRRKGSGYLKSTGTFFRKTKGKLAFFEFVYSLRPAIEYVSLHFPVGMITMTSKQDLAILQDFFIHIHGIKPH
jgi:hypothetical protein